MSMFSTNCPCKVQDVYVQYNAFVFSTRCLCSVQIVRVKYKVSVFSMYKVSVLSSWCLFTYDVLWRCPLTPVSILYLVCGYNNRAATCFPVTGRYLVLVSSGWCERGDIMYVLELTKASTDLYIKGVYSRLDQFVSKI